MDRSCQNYYKTHIAIHYLSHNLHIYVIKRLDEFVDENQEGRNTTSDWLTVLQEIAKTPRLLPPPNKVPTCGSDIAHLFAGSGGGRGQQYQENLDIQRIFKILKNCKLFHESDSDFRRMELIEKVVQIRNDFSHVSTKYPQAILSVQDRNDFFIRMQDLVSELEMPDTLLEKLQQIEEGTVIDALAITEAHGDYTDMPEKHAPGFIKFIESREQQCESREHNNIKKLVEDLSKKFQQNHGMAPMLSHGSFELEGDKNIIVKNSINTTIIHVHGTPKKSPKKKTTENSSGDHRKRGPLAAQESDSPIPKKRLRSGSSTSDQAAQERASSSSQTSPELSAINDVPSTSSVNTGPSYSSSKPSTDGDSSVSDEVRRMSVKVLKKELDEHGVDYKLIIEKKDLQDLLIKAKTEKQTGAGASDQMRGILQPKQEQPTASGSTKGSKSKGSKAKAPKKDGLIEVKEINRRRKTAKNLRAKVRMLFLPQLCENSKFGNWSFYFVLGSNGNTIDCRYFGEEENCIETHKYIKKNENAFFEISNYDVKAKFTKKTQKDYMKGNHPRCRLVMTQLSDICVIDD